MSKLTGNLSGRENDDGSFHAQGVYVSRRPKVSSAQPNSGISITMGWTICECAEEPHAVAIAEALNVKYADEIEATRALIRQHSVPAETST